MAQGTGLAVSWDEPSVSGSSITRYRVQWKGPGESYGETREEIVDSAYLSSEITGLAGGNTYVVRVAAESDDGLGEWAEAEGALPSLPGAPRSVDVVERHRGLVVTWDEPSVGDSPITRYWSLEAERVVATFGRSISLPVMLSS